MPPEPPHSRSSDTTNEDAEVHQAELDGYQPLSAHAADDLNSISDSSESSSDESDEEDTNSSEQRHRVCMTIQWPEDESEQQASPVASCPAAEFDGSRSLPALETSLLQSQCQERTGDHRQATTGQKDLAHDQKRPSAYQEGSSKSSTDRKDSSTDRKDSSNDRKNSCASWTDSCASRKDSSSGRMSEDQTEAVRSAMQTIRLPEAAVPDWARGLSDQQCQQRIGQMVAKLTGNR